MFYFIGWTSKNILKIKRFKFELLYEKTVGEPYLSSPNGYYFNSRSGGLDLNNCRRKSG